MADTTGLSAAQINALATAGATVTTVPAVTRAVTHSDASMRFYTADNGVPHVEIRTAERYFDAAVASLAGSGATFPITAAEAVTLRTLLQKLFVGAVLP